jgi:hypothetical protein
MPAPRRRATDHPVRTMSPHRPGVKLVLNNAKELDVNDELGGRFWMKLVGLVFLCGIGAVLLFLLVDAAWYRWGGIGALLFFFIVAVAYGAIFDRRAAKKYADEEKLYADQQA